MNGSHSLSAGRRILLVVILGVLSMLAPLGIDMYLPGMPAIARDLGASASAVQFTLSGFMLGFALGQLCHGPLSDSLGRKRVLLAGLAGYGLCAVLCALAPSVEALAILRLLQGASGAACATLVFALLRDIYDRKEDFARMMSFVGLVMMLAPLVAPLTGGWLLQWFGWRAIFWFLAFFSVVALAMVWLGIAETLPREGRPPLRLSAMLGNYRRLLGERQVVGRLLTGAFPAGGMFAFITAGAFVYIDLYGVSPQRFGFYFGLNIIGMIFFTVLNGQFVHRAGVERMLRAGLAAHGLAGLWLAAVVWLGLGFPALVAGVVVAVGSVAVVGSNAMALLMSGRPGQTGALSSLAGTIRFGAGALAGALVAMLPSHTAAPMALTMTGCALAAVASHVCLARPGAAHGR